MTCTFNHTIVAARDREASALFFREILEAAEAPSWGPFTNITLDGGVMIQFANLPAESSSRNGQTTQDVHREIQNQHYAFLVDDALFDRALGRIRERGLDHWADPQRTRPGETNTEHGGRGVYFLDPAGHYLELITRPYL